MADAGKLGECASCASVSAQRRSPFAVPRLLRNLPAAAPPCLASYASCAPALSWCHRSIVGSHTVTAIYKLCYKLRGAEECTACTAWSAADATFGADLADARDHPNVFATRPL